MSQIDGTFLPGDKKSSISLSTEDLVEILRHLSRKELCLLIYPVNRQFYNLATSSYHIPTIHLINELQFYRNGYSKSETRQQFISVEGSLKICLPAIEFIEKMPLPGPFVRFRQVTVKDSVIEDVVVKFLSDSKESFVGCKLVIRSNPNRARCDARTQILYLLKNVFNKPASISVDCGYLIVYDKNIRQLRISQLCRSLDTVVTCNKLQINVVNQNGRFMRPTQDLGLVLQRWLKSHEPLNEGSLQSGCMKHLIMIQYPQQLILEMVNQLRQEFENAATPSQEFVITFVASHENVSGCFEEFSEGFEFFLSRVLTSAHEERLSFFRHSQCVHRLWRRRVINEAEDAAMFLHLRAPKMDTCRFEDDGFPNGYSGNYGFEKSENSGFVLIIYLSVVVTYHSVGIVDQ
ncbi:hypothetical protein Ddc_15000 [Ditylenchus destructor]|nr:hypothetical protein Ddc_15000 [Ditylenchus destructor]